MSERISITEVQELITLGFWTRWSICVDLDGVVVFKNNLREWFFCTFSCSVGKYAFVFCALGNCPTCLNLFVNFCSRCFVCTFSFAAVNFSPSWILKTARNDSRIDICVERFVIGRFHVSDLQASGLVVSAAGLLWWIGLWSAFTSTWIWIACDKRLCGFFSCVLSSFVVSAQSCFSQWYYFILINHSTFLFVYFNVFLYNSSVLILF